MAYFGSAARIQQDYIVAQKLRMFMLSPADNTVMDKHYKYYQAKDTDDAQHNNHFSSPLSMLRIKNKIIKDVNIAQNITFWRSDSLAKNSPAKYPATMIFAKSPISFAIDSLDFGLSHFIYTIKHNIRFITCQVSILDVLKFTMTADSGKNAKLGEVKLRYNKK